MSLDDELAAAVKARNEAKERYTEAKQEESRKCGLAWKDYENAGKRIAEILQQKYGAGGVTVEKLR